MQFSSTRPTANKRAGKNTKEYIIIHHTGTDWNTTQGVINGFIKKGGLSCHYVVSENGDVHKIGEHDEILLHAGESAWDNKSDMNRYAIGIEVIGPLSGNKKFTDEQKRAVRELVSWILVTEKVLAKNILRHADISPGRKTDIDLAFIAPLSWQQYQNSFIPSPIKKMTEKQKNLTLKSGLMALQAVQPEIQTDAIKKAIDVLMAECEKVGIKI